jgi:HSP20 family molecular chaperone IbpA
VSADSIEAHFGKGVLHLKVKKPAEVEKARARSRGVFAL